MKTSLKTNGNRIQRTILKSFILIAMVTLSAAANGQNFWVSAHDIYSGSVQFITASESNEEVNLTTAGLKAILEAETEEALELENWMTSEKHFEIFVHLEKEIEKPLELEEWMTNEALFSVKSASETDAPLNLESWMTDEKHFSSVYTFEPDSDKALELEEWMVNAAHFHAGTENDKPLQLEDWMVADSFLK
ncbi:MAG: hypothetical protein ACOCVA_00390 [Prolixibacteraceae bacterium]